MARLNEPPVSTDSLETLRRKLLRQNRDLAKLNNVRALRIRELENECACMLSENIQLRGRVIDLEKQVDDNESRRIADHALAIKSQLESQLSQWGELIAGLGLEPPSKRRPSGIQKTSQRPISFNNNRPSPSQRRLRDVARDIEDLGSISEHKSFSRQSLNPEQILALRSEADYDDDAELGPPPMSQFIEEDPIKVDSPPASLAKQFEPGPRERMDPPEALPSPRADNQIETSPSPQKRRTDILSRPIKNTPKLQNTPDSVEPELLKPSGTDMTIMSPTKAGVKRKFTARGDATNTKPAHKVSNENQPPQLAPGKSSVREQAEGRTLKELSSMRKGERPAISTNRKPLSARSTNDDVSSPKKARMTSTDEVASAKAEVTQTKLAQKARGKAAAPKVVDIVPEPAPAPTTSASVPTPLAESDLVCPNPPQSAHPAEEASRGDTPPPADISSQGETSRGSRRSRGVVSYAEPNLRDKMRRPTKDLVDAVTGSRRSSQFDLTTLDSANSKRQSGSSSGAAEAPSGPEPGSIPASPLAKKGSQTDVEATAMQKRKRPCPALADSSFQDESTESVGLSDVDLYEFKTSPQVGKGRRKATGRQSKSSSRRFSTALEGDDGVVPTSQPSSSRRRSMVV
ncbi:Shugoshin C terminus [Geosmithia morbida]|uniref:Shugoshin C terminus n=1 Tax=Geosmithia morbida TaxID=1094350 RepID=A0A9P5D6Q4_9HYPO|nr:Shugoshin C terminus [Geosmithia morbida]KAF4123754.1 Shugoshin C terminus [Geosmithia morbida]